MVIDQTLIDLAEALEVAGKSQVYEFPDEAGLWRMILVPKIDIRLGRLTDLMQLDRVEGDAKGQQVRKSYRARADMALLFPREIALLLRAAGFRVKETFADYSGRAFSGSEDQYICVATKYP